MSMRIGEEAGDDEDLDLDLATCGTSRDAAGVAAPVDRVDLEPVKLAGEDDCWSDRRVCSATWWSKGRLAFARHDGDVVVASVPDMSNALGEEPEAFDGSPALVTCPRVTDEGTSERVVVLETPPPVLIIRGCASVAPRHAQRALAPGDATRPPGRGGVGRGDPARETARARR